jgi:hypothetical protein
MALSVPGADDALPTVRADQLALSSEVGRWLIDRIWSAGVGIIGGAPKCAKSWLGLEMAISVASGAPLLGRFAVHAPGPTLVYLAEDALPHVRERIAGVCTHRGLDLAALDLHVITAPVVRLDLRDDQRKLVATIDRIEPKLLVLDPLVRLHRLDENSSSEISALLGYLRELQRRTDLAVVLVHHMSKRGRPQLGQALRGSGDLHAWVDHGAYLTRAGDRLRLTLEHRTAPSADPLELRLVSNADGGGTHLELVDGGPLAGDESALAQPSLHQLVLAALRRAPKPLSRSELRALLRVNNNRLGVVLAELESSAQLLRSDDGLSLPR